jgi:hypothetical protein
MSRITVIDQRDAKADAAAKFAKSLMQSKGEIGTVEVLVMRAAGHGDADIVENIAHVGMNFPTNVLGKAIRVEIDLPKVESRLAA